MATVLSVGQCGYDDSRIGQLVRNAAGAFLERAASAEAAKAKLAAKKYELVLVNRMFDSGGEGLRLIEELKSAGEDTPIMLVSDYADAQATAVANGAVAGFGKSALAAPETAERIKAAMAKTDDAPV